MARRATIATVMRMLRPKDMDRYGTVQLISRILANGDEVDIWSSQMKPKAELITMNEDTFKIGDWGLTTRSKK